MDDGFRRKANGEDHGKIRLAVHTAATVNTHICCCVSLSPVSGKSVDFQKASIFFFKDGSLFFILIFIIIIKL